MKIKKLKVGFLLDPVEKLDVSDDTSLLLFNEFKSRGHEPFYIHSSDIFVQNGKLMARLCYGEYNKNFDPISIRIKVVTADTLDCLMVRLEPPYDLNYFYITHLLNLIKKNVFLVNYPKGLREVSEKLFILKYPELIPPTIVSKDIRLLKQFILSYRKVIVKQLNMFASKQLVIIDSSSKELHEPLKFATNNGEKYVMAQKYLDDIHVEGDKRILFLDGKIIGAYKRVPKKNDFRSDPDYGGENMPAILSKKEDVIYCKLAKDVLAHGIYFGGIDSIGGKLTEINVTCPAGIIPINKLYNKKLEKDFVDFVEKKVVLMKEKKH
ncbi:MAG: hypothetical protein HZA77_15800 [Candidatus Schekmanbacteria bacterium]|nr:hypothetical protein [Candidatus Schekmanbacteria bacterium]